MRPTFKPHDGNIHANILVDENLFLKGDCRNPVKVHSFGCVKIPYRGYVISFHAEGEDIQIEYEEKSVITFSNSYASFDDNLQACISFIDAQYGD